MISYYNHYLIYPVAVVQDLCDVCVFLHHEMRQQLGNNCKKSKIKQHDKSHEAELLL